VWGLRARAALIAARARWPATAGPLRRCLEAAVDVGAVAHAAARAARGAVDEARDAPAVRRALGEARRLWDDFRGLVYEVGKGPLW
jgi:hypothetical protein